jgi:hypothetical protein
MCARARQRSGEPIVNFPQPGKLDFASIGSMILKRFMAHEG